MKYLLPVLAIIATNLSCNNGKKNYVKKVITLAGYERAEKDTTRAYMELTLLNIYPVEYPCNDSEIYANLFIAKKLNGNIIYVFEPCSKIDEYLFDTTGRYTPIIDTTQILHGKLNKVIVCVPNDFDIPKGAKYLVSRVTNMAEE
jgi:hypothetical protein